MDYVGYVLDLPEQIEEAFEELYRKYCIDMPLTAKKSNVLDSFWEEIGDRLTLADDNAKKYNGQKSKILYHDVKTIEEVLKTYLKLCDRFGVIPKIDMFAALTNINRDTFYRWNNANRTNQYIFNMLEELCIEDYKTLLVIVNDDNSLTKVITDNRFLKDDEKGLSRLRYDVLKKLRNNSQQFVRNALMDSNIGPAAIANNDAEVGLMWDAKRQLTGEAIKQGNIALTAVDLPKLNG